MTQEQTGPPDAGFDPQRLREAPLQMRRSLDDRHIAGVCGGFAAYARIDPVVVRVVTAALSITGAGIVLYLAAWALVPEQGSETAAIDGYHRSARDDVRRIGWVVAGLLAFAALVSAGPWFDAFFFWPLAALIVLAWLWLASDRNRDRDRDPAGDQPVYASTPSATGAYSGAAFMYPDAEPRGIPVEPLDGAGGPPAGQGLAPPAPRPPRQRRGDGSLALLTLCLALVALGVLWIVDRTDTELHAPAYLAAVLAIMGVGMLVGSVVGNGRRLVAPAVLVAAALLVASQVTVWRAGEIVQTPSAAAGVLPSYALAAGSIRLDLSEVADLEGLDGRTVSFDLAAGQILVTVPDGVDLTVSASQRLGELVVLGRTSHGFRNNLDLTEPDTAAPDLHLVLRGSFGRAEVLRS